MKKESSEFEYGRVYFKQFGAERVKRERLPQQSRITLLRRLGNSAHSIQTRVCGLVKSDHTFETLRKLRSFNLDASSLLCKVYMDHAVEKHTFQETALIELRREHVAWQSRTTVSRSHHFVIQYCILNMIMKYQNAPLCTRFPFDNGNKAITENNSINCCRIGIWSRWHQCQVRSTFQEHAPCDV